LFRNVVRKAGVFFHRSVYIFVIFIGERSDILPKVRASGVDGDNVMSLELTLSRRAGFLRIRAYFRRPDEGIMSAPLPLQFIPFSVEFRAEFVSQGFAGIPIFIAQVIIKDETLLLVVDAVLR
jgi:hypothetical protein